LPQVFTSDEYVVTFAGPGETAEHLATQFLGDPRRAWMIEDYNHTHTFTVGQEIVIPKHSWNPTGVDPSGYQVVPVLTYYSFAPQAKGRLVMAVPTFEAQMRYLNEHGYRVVSLRDLLAAGTLGRQLPRRAVVLTFSDGWESFREYAAPILKGLGFPATVFIYTDFIGAGSALSWADLRALAAEGFDIEVESKTHGDLRKKSGESDDDYARRLDEELTQPLKLVQQYLGTEARALAYPYGAHDEEVERAVKTHGYEAAFDVRRQANPIFAAPLELHRAQIYADMNLDQFAKSLEVFDGTSGP
jgi:peptidoglycan/xylan/chitin deacetylase (PgdA/CDA1 family)